MQDLKNHFLLDPKVTFLNFGSFGACPKPVFEAYQNWQLELEKEPVQYMLRKGPQQLEVSRKALADYVGCEASNLLFVPNPTYGLNIVIKNLNLQPGDEVLSTDLEYGACDRSWEFYCSLRGATFKRQHIELPVSSEEQIVEDVFKGLSKKTKVVFVSHITSSTGMILPAEKICRRAKQEGLLCIVDGAHVPGHIPLNITALGADVYTGACHKWMMAPKGCSFLYATPALQTQLDPLIVSWGYKSAKPSGSQFLDYHQHTGTRDYSAYLCVPDCLSFMREHNWEEVSKKCKALVLQSAPKFIELLQSPALTPLNTKHLGQMLSLQIRCNNPEALQTLLYDKYHIEIPVIPFENKVFIRFSINGFNTSSDLDKLYEALKQIKAEGQPLLQ
ncbi:MAG: aminotransferase class V-fold PLP-dependent enzyme [Bacteroidia bacterium]|nr:aminotransferase class V-fold PLP-dependent enzyme [Bacteroidia bacterium]